MAIKYRIHQKVIDATSRLHKTREPPLIAGKQLLIYILKQSNKNFNIILRRIKLWL